MKYFTVVLSTTLDNIYRQNSLNNSIMQKPFASIFLQILQLLLLLRLYNQMATNLNKTTSVHQTKLQFITDMVFKNSYFRCLQILIMYFLYEAIMSLLILFYTVLYLLYTSIQIRKAFLGTMCIATLTFTTFDYI